MVIYPTRETIATQDSPPLTPDTPGLDSSGDFLQNGSIISLQKCSISLLESSLAQQVEITQNPVDIDAYVDSQYIHE